MRNVPAGLAAHLAGGVTTLCRCWRVTRADGVIQGFTDHDEDLAFDATTFLAGSGFEGTEIESKLGMSVGGTEIHGALSSDALTEADLAAGRYDAARVELFLVDWSNVENRLLLRVGDMGEVRREGVAFAAEVRGLSHRLDEERGRIFAAGCDADLGDVRCTVNLDDAAFRGTGTVAAVQGTALVRVTGLDGFADGWFSRGRLAWTSGANDGFAVEVKEHRAEGAVTLSLWQIAPEPMSPGDAFTVTAGCDKRFDTCREKFGNALNFRGFPHMPGNDFVTAYAVPGEPGHDGAGTTGGAGGG
jgi:uncharacterized phage protein (TIGR02218 family)